MLYNSKLIVFIGIGTFFNYTNSDCLDLDLFLLSAYIKGIYNSINVYTWMRILNFSRIVYNNACLGNFSIFKIWIPFLFSINWYSDGIPKKLSPNSVITLTS